jgi:hypothetical protein
MARLGRHVPRIGRRIYGLRTSAHRSRCILGHPPRAEKTGRASEMNKKLAYIFAVLVAISSCSLVKQPFSFQKETGFQRNVFETSYYAISDVERMDKDFDFGQKEIHIKNSRLSEHKGVVHWEGKAIDKNGYELPLVDLYEDDSTCYHYLGTSDFHGAFSIDTRNAHCKGFYLEYDRMCFWDIDATIIRRGITLGDGEINIETHQAYVKRGFAHWQGKTTDENGDAVPFVEFYEIDSTYYEDLQNTDKYHESYYGHFLGSSDEHGNFNIRSRTKSCQGFFVDQIGYLGTIYYLRSK